MFVDVFQRTFRCLPFGFIILNFVTLSSFCEDLGQLSLCSDSPGWMILGSNPQGVREFSVLQNGQTGSWDLPASYSIGTGGSFAGRKGVGT